MIFALFPANQMLCGVVHIDGEGDGFGDGCRVNSAYIEKAVAMMTATNMKGC